MRTNQRPEPTESFIGEITKAPGWLKKCAFKELPVKVENNRLVISIGFTESLDSNGNILDSRYVSKPIISRTKTAGHIEYILDDQLVFKFKLIG